MKPIRPIPQTAYIKAKNVIANHPLLHFFLHNTYCRLMFNYKHTPYGEFQNE